jgi:hypothetical protein
VPADQALAEADVLTTRSLGRGWRPVPMVNNAERLRPFGDDAASIAVEAARVRRGPTGLDEGRAWRHRDAGTLLVVRAEVYADAEPGVAASHRAAWHEHAPAALAETWRQRWRERDRIPGWIEARWQGVRPLVDDHGVPVDGCDWLRVEDHTGAVDPALRVDPEAAVAVYEHLTVWAGRRQVTVVVRHQLGLDLDDVVDRCAREIGSRFVE